MTDARLRDLERRAQDDPAARVELATLIVRTQTYEGRLALAVEAQAQARAALHATCERCGGTGGRREWVPNEDYTAWVECAAGHDDAWRLAVREARRACDTADGEVRVLGKAATARPGVVVEYFNPKARAKFSDGTRVPVGWRGRCLRTSEAQFARSGPVVTRCMVEDETTRGAFWTAADNLRAVDPLGEYLRLVGLVPEPEPIRRGVAVKLPDGMTGVVGWVGTGDKAGRVGVDLPEHMGRRVWAWAHELRAVTA